ncbi:MAG: FKBP-type peptidyl-prolyl cis-trans isomerase [Nannocystaceae bacterium]
MTARTPLLILSALWIFAACTGEPPQVGYGPSKEELEAKTRAKPIEIAIPPKGPTDAQANQATNQAPPTRPPPQAPKVLPKEPSPDIVYPEPFNGAIAASQALPSGIKVDDFVVGSGAEAVKGAEVEVHYTGYLTDGSTFDSSIPRGRPFRFDLGAGRVIKGWDEGIAGMKVGGKRRLIIPAELGYGPRAAGKIPPNSTLIFTVELLGVTPPPPPPQPLTAFEGTPVKTAKIEGIELVDYKIGTGAAAKAGDEVEVHYAGTLTADGTEFDSSHPRMRPIKFVLGRGQVIKGWDLGIEGMKVGGLRKLVIPAALAYGERARGKIPANADLTFRVELMSAKPLPAPPAPPTPIKAPPPRPRRRRPDRKAPAEGQ